MMSLVWSTEISQTHTGTRRAADGGRWGGEFGKVTNLETDGGDSCPTL